jgi:hypothetical protein
MLVGCERLILSACGAMSHLALDAGLLLIMQRSEIVAMSTIGSSSSMMMKDASQVGEHHVQSTKRK